MKIGLALGGGGAKGLFHIGVFRAFDKLGIRIDKIAATSMGAVIGGLYALFNDTAKMEERFFEVFFKHYKDLIVLKNWMESVNPDKKSVKEKTLRLVKGFFLWNLYIIKPGLSSAKPFIRLFKEMFRGADFDDCQLPLSITSVDLFSGDPVVINKDMPLHRAVMASSALPGIFPPLKWFDKLLVDGGVLLPVPVGPLKDPETFVIGVNLEELWEKPSIRNASDVLLTADRVRYKKILSDNLAQADFLLFPKLDNIGWGDFHKSKKLVKMGEEFVMDQSDKLLGEINKFKKS